MVAATNAELLHAAGSAPAASSTLTRVLQPPAEAASNAGRPCALTSAPARSRRCTSSNDRLSPLVQASQSPSPSPLAALEGLGEEVTIPPAPLPRLSTPGLVSTWGALIGTSSGLTEAGSSHAWRSVALGTDGQTDAVYMCVCPGVGR